MRLARTTHEPVMIKTNLFASVMLALGFSALGQEGPARSAPAESPKERGTVVDRAAPAPALPPAQQPTPAFGVGGGFGGGGAFAPGNFYNAVGGSSSSGGVPTL